MRPELYYLRESSAFQRGVLPLPPRRGLGSRRRAPERRRKYEKRFGSGPRGPGSLGDDGEDVCQQRCPGGGQTDGKGGKGKAKLINIETR